MLEESMKKYLEFYVFLKTLKIMEASKANDVCRPVTDPHIQPVVLTCSTCLAHFFVGPCK
jgi:hypothetical protein